MVSRIISRANKLGGGWERDQVQRAAKRYDDDGHGKYIGSRLLLLAAVIMAARAPPPTKEQTSNHKDKRRGAKILAALHRVEPEAFGAPHNFQPIET